MRTVICHYHIYKNSGSTYDALLAENYGDRHICFDGPFPFFSIDQEQLARIIERKRDLIAFSSHQIQLPVPVSLDFHVLPVVFVRQPLLRVHSIYKFKRQAYDGTVTSKAAREKSFDEWLQYCFSDRAEITHISNAQTRIMGAGYRQRPLMRRTSSGMEYDIHQAMRNLENVRLLARTECFYEDVGRFPEILRQHGIAFEFRKIAPRNVTSNDHGASVIERVAQVKQLLQQTTYQQLVDANWQDVALYESACSLIQERPKQATYSGGFQRDASPR